MSEKDSILSDENHKSWKRFLCFNQIKQQTIFIALVIILLIIITLLAIFRIITINELNSRNVSKSSKLSCRSEEKTRIKRELVDYDDMEEFLGKKYNEVNKNFVDDESERNLHKRSNYLKNSIQELETTMEKSENFIKSILNKPSDEETANLIEKDLRDVEDEINGLDDDIVSLLEISDLIDKSSRKRVRHKRDLFDNFDLNPIAISMYAPAIDEKKREKRLIQQKLAEVRDEFVRCKKSTGSTVPPKSDDCEKVYHKVIDRFRQITKKFKEIEDIVNDMETLGMSQQKGHSSEESSEEKKDKKKKKEKKKKDKKSSEETKNYTENVISNSTITPTQLNSTLPPTTESNFSSSPTTTTHELEAITAQNDVTESTTFSESTTTSILSTDSTSTVSSILSTDSTSTTVTSETTSSTQSLIVQPDNLVEDETSTISIRLGNAHIYMRDEEKTDESCPISNFQQQLPQNRQHHKFAEELSDSYRLGSKFYAANHKNDHIVSDRMHERVNPQMDSHTEVENFNEPPPKPQHHKIVEELSDNYQLGSKMYHSHPKHDHIISDRMHERVNPFLETLDIIADRIESDLDNQLDFSPPGVRQPQSEESSEPLVQASHSAARETFTSLCDNLSKNNNAKQATPPQFIGDTSNFVPIQLSGFSNPMNFPPTTGEVKGSSKVVMNQGYSGIMPYPICFVQYPPVRQMQYYPYPVGYSGMYPYNAMPVMHQYPTQPGGNFHGIDPRIDKGYYVNAGRPPMGVGSAQTYRDASENNMPTYCAFLPNNDANFPNAYFEQTTAQPQTTPSEDKIDENNRANSYNIPSQFDIIYATYPNQIFAMNQSTQHHHCEKEKLPCFSTNQCISKSKWCDSKVDCIDASDETACSCKARLDESRICDGFIDCPMGSDEMGCFGCDRFQYSCYISQEEYEKSGQSSKSMCYSSTEKCDGFNHCKNGKDEIECTMIVKNFGSVNSYLVSHSEGVLHRNYKGRWYPVCKHASKWAMEACEADIGKLNSKPHMTIKSGQISGMFIQPSFNHDNQQVDYEPSFSESCQLDRDASPNDNHVVYVKCDQPKCGSSKLSESESSTRFTRQVDNTTKEIELEATRIVGGVEALPMEFPFIVAIFKDGHFHCGGSIYDEQWIITAAHCTRAFENHYYEVRAGIIRRSSHSPMAHISKVTHVIRHEDYDRSTMKNDIALMRVKHHFNFNKWIRPVCLPNKERTGIKDWLYGPKAGTICTTLGWGALRERGPDPDSLQVVEVPILSKCKYMNDQQGESVCAGEKVGLKDACQGDSGGPLVCKSENNRNEWYLTGIVSHGEGCARANEPGVYTRTALYLDWITTNIDKPLPTNAPSQNCPGMVCVWGAQKCIAKASHCNSVVDCLGGEDEINCPLNWLDLMLSERSNDNVNVTSTVDPNKVSEHIKENKKVAKKDLGNHDVFRCTKISQVINIAQRCDRVFDCEDGSDEQNCTCKDHLKGKFAKLLCDGTVDCADSTDEIGCVTCKPTELLCPLSKTCIDQAKQCNGEVDCKFKEDELDCLALTDGHSINLDVNGKPFMHTKGIVTRNIESNWKVLCDDTGDFTRNGSEIANDICSLIGFKFAKSFNVIEIATAKIETNSIARSKVMIKLVKEIDKSDIENCKALEIECSAIPSNTFAMHSINQEKSKKNATKNQSDVHFVPSNPDDQKNIFVKPININSWDHLRDFEWPWSAEIFLNGEIVGNGILLDNSWILADKTILGSEQEPLKTKHAIAIVGNSKHHLNILSPYEQISKIDCLQFIKDSNVVLLHLKDRIHFNRHVLPSFLPTQVDTEPDSRCIAVALSSQKITRSLELKVITECPNDVHLTCYQVARNESSLCTDSETSHRVAAILCKKKSSSWFPKAFYRMSKGFCDFISPVSVLTLRKGNVYDEIQKIINSSCDKCSSVASEINCDTHRCALGKCLTKNQLCNGISECRDGSDETKEVCEKVKDDKKCAANEFQCHSGQCVDKIKFCDHVHDCMDKSDEPSECTCFDFLRTTNPKKICDGIVHCWDRTDEDAIYCGGKCEGKFKCNNSFFCVPQELICDKRNDCPNGADEMHCHGLLEKSDGFGEIVQRTMGLWHTKCYPKSSEPTQDDVNEMCKQLGFTDVKTPQAKLRGLADENKKDKPTSIPFVPIEFHSSNASKVILHSKFAPTKINDGFTVHLKTDKPLGKIVAWEKEDHENCYRLEIKCN